MLQERGEQLQCCPQEDRGCLTLKAKCYDLPYFSAQVEGRPWIGQLSNCTRKETDMDRNTSLAPRRCSAYVEITPYRLPDPRVAQLLLTCLPHPDPVSALTMLSAYSRQTYGPLA